MKYLSWVVALAMFSIISCTVEEDAYKEPLEFIEVEKVDDDGVVRFGKLYYIHVNNMKYLLIKEIDGGSSIVNVTLDEAELNYYNR